VIVIGREASHIAKRDGPARLTRRAQARDIRPRPPKEGAMTEDYNEHKLPKKNEKYFTDRHLDPDKLADLPHVQAIFERDLTDDQIQILDDLGIALETDLHTHPEDAQDVEFSADDPEVKLKGYVFVVH
jgi:hypothetical protein